MCWTVHLLFHSCIYWFFMYESSFVDSFVCIVLYLCVSLFVSESTRCISSIVYSSMDVLVHSSVRLRCPKCCPRFLGH